MSDVAIDGRRRKLQEYLEKGATHKLGRMELLHCNFLRCMYEMLISASDVLAQSAEGS